MDVDKTLIESARTHIKKANLIVHDGHKLPFPDKEFDVIFSLQVIEHLKNPSSFFAESNRVLKLNGFLIISTPNPEDISAGYLKTGGKDTVMTIYL